MFRWKKQGTDAGPTDEDRLSLQVLIVERARELVDALPAWNGRFPGSSDEAGPDSEPDGPLIDEHTATRRSRRIRTARPGPQTRSEQPSSGSWLDAAGSAASSIVPEVRPGPTRRTSHGTENPGEKRLATRDRARLQLT
jgi:hypothetical protein